MLESLLYIKARIVKEDCGLISFLMTIMQMTIHLVNTGNTYLN